MKNIYKSNCNRKVVGIVLLTMVACVLMLCCAFSALSATKPYAYVSTQFGTRVYVIDLSSNTIIDTIDVFTMSGMDYLTSDIRIYKNKAYLTVPGDMFNLTNEVKIIDTDVNSVVGNISTDKAPSGITVYNDKIYVLNRSSSSIHEIDPIANSILRTITFSTSYPNSPIFLEVTNDKIYLPCPGSGGSAGGVEVLDLATGLKIKSIDFDSLDNYGPIGIKKVGVNKIYVGGHQDVGVIDIGADSLMKIIRVKNETAGFIIAFTKFGNKVYTANGEGTSSVIDASSDTLIKQIIVGYCSYCAYGNLDAATYGDKVYITIPTDGVKIIDAITDQLVDSIAVPDYPGALDILEQRSFNILSVSDVPNDQGKQIQVIWQRYGGENDNSFPVKQYGVWRMDDSPISKSVPTINSFDEIGNLFGEVKSGDRFNISGEVWTFVGWSPVSGLDNYSSIVPTLFDSTLTGGMYWSKFKVSGHSSDFSLQVWSNVDSGYSLDNHIPQAPLAFNAAVVPPVIQLSWESPNDPDLNYYAIYRGTTEGFDYEHTPPIATTTGKSYDDSNVNNGERYYYVIRAFDFSGNKGLVTKTSVLFTGINEGEGTPTKFALHQNFPNPFNPSTIIRYELPVASKVTLRVYNLLGQIVATLADEAQSVGYKIVEWNPTGLTSGLYYYRLDAVSINDPGNTFLQMRKMMLLK